METSGNGSDSYTNSTQENTSTSGGGGGNNQRLGFGRMQLSALNFFRSPLSFLLDYSGILPPATNHRETEPLIAVNGGAASPDSRPQSPGPCVETVFGGTSSGEVSIQIIGGGEQEGGGHSVPSQGQQAGEASLDRNGESVGGMPVSENQSSGGRSDNGAAAAMAGGRVPSPPAGSGRVDSVGVRSSGDDNSRDSYPRNDIQQFAKWTEQVLPFSLLLLVVFIRQHLQGFFVTIWISAVLFKSNDVVRKQTSLKGERKVPILVGITIAFMLHVVGIYWWYRNDDLLYPLVMLPPKAIPPFWHAIFIILVNDTMVRQAAMAFKCLLLIYYKNGRGHNFRRQGQLLTLIEYAMLLYRALLPTPVWYRFFLNREYGSLFSSLTTGLYLTFKLTAVVDKVQSFFAAIKALSRKEVHYGSYATSEQVNAAGDLCAICQEKMHVPILLRCKHIFCEDCVSEWFERERTCPLCRALVKPAGLRTFGDGSTSLFFELF
ncbi:uncharacterized protein LOC107414042 [Ziziphus jujuba]|uniref:Uncharacterized protein LOC107414042 n=1 Tax=Ziziphus jujuba TaxID=326968 RepID=A0A6P3ZVR5_ZIZJJ|nr:uncharacterized protein LOC107414042 [Ziziphus jujuba]